MNPRQRRWLIPGLLIALLVVVVVASLAGRAGAATEAALDEPAVTIDDPRITESSGLAVSRSDPTLAYTVNDSGGATEIYAIDLESGDVVGVTEVNAPFVDVEALALEDGRLWIADTGDNNAVRSDVTLLVIDEPGRASRTVTPTRYPLVIEGGPTDIETVLVDPSDSRVHLVTKGLMGGSVLAAPSSGLVRDRPTTMTHVTAGMPALVTDGAFSPDGSTVALLSYGLVWTLAADDWQIVGRQALPPLQQAETLAFVTDDQVLVGNEGSPSPLYRLSLEPVPVDGASLATVATARPPSPAPTPTAVPARTSDPEESGFTRWWFGAAAVMVLAAGVAARRRGARAGGR